MNRYTIKDFPFVVMIIIVSIALGIYFAANGKAENPKNYTAENTQATESTSKSEDNNSENQNAESNINETDTSSVQTETTIENTTENMQTVDDSYFDDALFIGDSRTVGLYLYGSIAEDAPNATFFADVGTSLYEVTDVSLPVPPQNGKKEKLEKLLSNNNYGKIYIMLGVNDLGTGTPESFGKAYSELIDYIKNYQPNSIIYIESLISITRDAESKSEYVTLANLVPRNQQLEALADPSKNIYYLNLNEVLTDSNGYLNDSYTSDGIHLKADSLPLWENYLRSHAVPAADNASNDDINNSESTSSISTEIPQ